MVETPNSVFSNLTFGSSSRRDFSGDTVLKPTNKTDQIYKD